MPNRIDTRALMDVCWDLCRRFVATLACQALPCGVAVEPICQPMVGTIEEHDDRREGSALLEAVCIFGHRLLIEADTRLAVGVELDG